MSNIERRLGKVEIKTEQFKIESEKDKEKLQELAKLAIDSIESAMLSIEFATGQKLSVADVFALVQNSEVKKIDKI